jgi:ketosteroid isomerase-like protein
LFIFYSVVAQHDIKKDLQSLIATEYAFARMAREQNTRDAFLKYLGDETVMFMNSQIARGKKLWQERKPDSSLIIWEPVFADISASGDFGYTTGPSEYYANRRQGEQAFYGAYITVWKKQGKSNWRMGLDIGVYPQPKPSSKTLTTPSLPTPITRKRDDKPGLLEQESRLINALSSLDIKQYESMISTDCRFYRAGMETLTNLEKIKELVRKQSGTIEYTLVDGDASSAGDLGYVYGKVKIREQTKVTDGFYLRIYKKQNAMDWKIVLDAIHQ